VTRTLRAALTIGLLALSGATHAKPVVTFKIDHYEVTGNTVTEIQRSIGKRTPIRSGTKFYGGVTRWKLDTTYKAREMASGGCAVIEPVVYLDVQVLLPKLVPGPRITRPVLAEWDRFLGALRAHEQLHALNGLHTARTLEQRMTNLKTAFNCQKMRDMLTEASQALIKNINQRDIDMDRETNHGETQGAYLNTEIDRR
jgi:predicted secreted Zn-dependent protease